MLLTVIMYLFSAVRFLLLRFSPLCVKGLQWLKFSLVR